jgi:outer membrane protein assembly factor BamB
MKKYFLLFGFALCFFLMAQAQEGSKDSSGMKELTGKYVFPSGSVIPHVEVKVENGALVIVSAAGTSPLVKQEGDLYSISANSGTAKFNRDTNKKVIGVSIDARGYQLEGTKEAESSVAMIQKKEFVTKKLFVTVSVR